MEFHIVIPVLISFAISAVLGPVIIPFLRKLKMGQTERTEGVQTLLSSWKIRARGKMQMILQ